MVEIDILVALDKLAEMDRLDAIDKLVGLGGFVKVIFNGVGEDVGLG